VFGIAAMLMEAPALAMMRTYRATAKMLVSADDSSHAICA
jgi:hypothetical protein